MANPPNNTPALFGKELSVIKAAKPAAPVAPPMTELDTFFASLSDSETELMSLLPIANINLTPEEIAAARQYMRIQIVMGPVASAPMLCSKECPVPFRNQCSLAKAGKEPIGERCPWEVQYSMQRFLKWMGEIGRTLHDISETDRISIQSLVTLDLHERRCSMILAEANSASLTSRAVRDVDVNTGVPICWEDVMHANVLRMEAITTQRRMILKDMELTAEAQTKRKKTLSGLKAGRTGMDLATRQSDTRDKILRAIRGEVVDV